MCDGAFTHKGLTLCTDSFTLKDVVILMNVLLIKYNIRSNLHNAGEGDILGFMYQEKKYIN